MLGLRAHKLIQTSIVHGMYLPKYLVYSYSMTK